jgi:hypothetical protein
MPPRMNPFRSEKYVVIIGVGQNRYKVLQIVFGQKDGSLFVTFPYYQHSEGLVSVATLAGGKGGNKEIKLVPGGKVTSHLVKYSHHPDGMALFSQDGRVLSDVRKKSVPLSESEGHVFTTQFQYLKAFEVADTIKDRNKYDPQRSVIVFGFGGEEPEAIKIVGRWYTLEELLSRIVVNDGKTKIFGPRIHCRTDRGREYAGFLLSPPVGNPMDKFALLLTCEAIPRLDKIGQTCLTFIGGFDPLYIVNNLEVDTKMLALSYPASNYDELRKSIGSIDIWSRVKTSKR